MSMPMYDAEVIFRLAYPKACEFTGNSPTRLKILTAVMAAVQAPTLADATQILGSAGPWVYPDDAAVRIREAARGYFSRPVRLRLVP